MEWKPVHIPKSELERKQSDYTREALEMARRARPGGAPVPTPPSAEVKPAPVPEPIPVPIPVPEPAHVPPPPPDIISNQSKTIEINADLDVDVDVDVDVDIININIEPQKPAKPPRKIPRPEVVPLVAAADRAEPQAEVATPPAAEEEPQTVVFPEEAIVEELCANEADIEAFKDETDNPFAHFAGCDFASCECKQEHHPRCNSARHQRPPNFDKFINEHNRNVAGISREGHSCGHTHSESRRRQSHGGQSCAESSAGRGFSTGGGTMPGQGNAPGGFSWKDFKKN